MIQRLVLSAALSCLLLPPAWGQTSLRGMQTGEDFRLGPVITTGLPIGQNQVGDRQYYQFALQGESPNHGFSRIFLRVISLYELLDLPRLNDTSGAIERQIRFHHQFISLGFNSPLFYELSSPLNLEFGWEAGFNLAKVTFKNPQKSESTGIISVFSDYPEIKPSELGARVTSTNPAQAETQFIGGELGFYSRYYGLYPFVPYAGLRINLGSYFDANGFIKGVAQNQASSGDQSSTPAVSQRVYQSGFRFSPIGAMGFDFYLGSRGLLGAELTFWNWDIINRPQDNTLFLNIKAGYLF